MDKLLLVEDEFGETMQVREIRKNRYIDSTFSAGAVKGISEFSLRDDDVLMCSYPKCGMHWLWENIRMIAANKVMMDTVDKDSIMMEYFLPGQMDHIPSPRLLNNHLLFEEQPSDLLAKGTCKIVLLYRNPKDLAVSWYYHLTRWAGPPGHQYTGSFSHFLRRLAKGNVVFNSPFDYWKKWEKGLKENPQLQYITVCYEDLQKDTVAELRRISTFLGYFPNDDFLKSVVQTTSFDSMKKIKSQDCLIANDGDPVIYRKGKVGDWKDHFTVADDEWFQEYAQKEMGSSKLFKFAYSLD